MTIRVHYYEDRDGLSVCKNCGMVENKDRIGPSWCSGKLPSVGLRVPETGLSVERGAVLSVTDESVLALRAELADVLAERDAMQSIATQASRELSRVTAERDALLHPRAYLPPGEERRDALLVIALKERDEARDAYKFRGGYIEDASGARWWSAELVARLEAKIAELDGKVAAARREGAEAMREACYRAVDDDYYWKYISAIRVEDVCGKGET